jgi:hypothetical protein
MQDFLMNKIYSLSHKYKEDKYHDCVINYIAANVGTVFFIDEDLNTLGSFTFDYQFDNFYLRFYKGNDTPVRDRCSTNQSVAMIHGKYESMSDAIAQVKKAIAEIFSITD